MKKDIIDEKNGDAVDKKNILEIITKFDCICLLETIGMITH